MPCFRGIELSLVSSNGKLPEYPHPDASSVRLVGLQRRQDITGEQGQPVSVDATSRETISIPKDNPKISVYVPTPIGAPFSISYTVSQRPLDPCKYLFFKLFMNGRAITSCGIDLDDRSTGRVAQSLWKPSEQWDSLAGVEARTFEFLAVQEDKPLAEEGGMIEIQVFRAKARRQRALRLEAVRGGEMYGIGVPSAGLLERPEEVKYYDWHLLDPKESPYAAFRFYYRSWENLVDLQLVPSGDRLLTQTESPYSTVSTPPYPSPPPPSPVSPSPSPSQGLCLPYNIRRDPHPADYLQKPLPALPHDEGEDSLVSESSETPSLSLSVLRAFENRLPADDGNISVETATTIRCTRVVASCIGSQPEGTTPVSEAAIPAPAAGNMSPPPPISELSRSGADSPSKFRASFGALVGRKLISNQRPKSAQGFIQNAPPRAQHTGNAPSTPTESEWFRGWPLPTQRGAGGSLLSRMWNSLPARKSAKEFLANFRKDKGGPSRSKDDASGVSAPRPVRDLPDDNGDSGTGV